MLILYIFLRKKSTRDEPGTKIVIQNYLFVSWCSAHDFSPIPSKRIMPDIQFTWNLPYIDALRRLFNSLFRCISWLCPVSSLLAKHTWSVNLAFFLIDPPGFFQKKKALNQYLRRSFLHWNWHAFYSAILTSCTRHDVNNVTENRNAGDLAPKQITW